MECSASTDPTASATATDNCDNAPAVTYTDSRTGGSCNGVITRTWTATDACGNTASTTSTVTIVDTTVPVITAPPNMQVRSRSAV